jgi:uncharacterized protein (TIGR00290 family)
VEKVLVSWSSGKDSAWTLHILRQQAEIEVAGLLTTINAHFDRVAMHGTRHELLKLQAEATGIPLWEIPIPWPCSNKVYEQAMATACTSAIKAGISAVAFGDLFLEDVRRYREEHLHGTGLKPLFPLWGRNTRALILEMIDKGLLARIVCLDPSKMPVAFAGRDLDHELLLHLPETVDPCGENGEFHTFVHAGPMFHDPISITSRECVTRDGFVFADVIPSIETQDRSPRRPLRHIVNSSL